MSTREEVLQTVRDARKRDEIPDLNGANLRGVDLHGVDLHRVDLHGVDLHGVDLRWANLSGIDLSWANLHMADLRWANLRNANLCNANLRNAYLRNANLNEANLHGVDLRGANLRNADLCEANLHWADLRVANLRNANLTGADLHSANLFRGLWDGLAIDGLHRYRCLLTPAVDGWTAIIGCWAGTVDELRELIAGDDWPESTGDEITRLRPLLVSFCDMCDAYISAHPSVIDDLAARWSK